MSKQEPYRTEKAWEGLEAPELKYWRRMAEYFRKENKELKKEIANLKEEDNYIESVVLKGKDNE
tara:strand:+ start:1089 stop:1280 length:192 start_codon:yes stop_codon:yes gene_type:complete